MASDIHAKLEDIHAKLDAEIKLLKEELKIKDDKIELLEQHVLSLETVPLQNKKRRLDSSGHLMMNEEAMKKAYNNEIEIERLTKENECLKAQIQCPNKQPPEQQHITQENDKKIIPGTDPLIKTTQNPSMPTIETLFQDMQKTISIQLSEVKESIQASIDEKIKKACYGIQPKTYASATTENPDQLRPTAPAGKTVNELRSVMMNTKNEELAEETEKKARARNFVLHGKEEVSEADDEEFIKNLFKQLAIGNTTAKTLKRIGAQRAEKKRPILVQMKDEDEKSKVMDNLKNLKGLQEYKGISIKDDYTLAEREMIQEFQQQANTMNDENNEEETIYRVRGCPKNGLYLKKMKKNQR